MVGTHRATGDDDVTPSESALERAWRGLAQADALVQGFGERGWIADETLAALRERTHDLARRVGRAQQRGGHPGDEDPALTGEIDRLTALLVALSDEAVTRQPDLAPEVPVVVTLADAQQRLAATDAAYRDLG